MRPITFQSSIVVETLRALEQHVHAHHEPLAKLSAELGGHRFERALAAADELRHALATVLALYQRLHANVVPADGLGPVASIGELVLRARRMVLLAQLGRLRRLLSDPVRRARAQSWLVGRFETIDDVTVFIQDELTRLMGLWTRHRYGITAHGPAVDEAALYHAAVRVAQRALSDLGQDPDLAYFLRAGGAVTEWPEVAMGVREISAVLATHIDVEPSGTAHTPMPPIRNPEGTPSRQP